MRKKVCKMCGNQLRGEELEYPNKGYHGAHICDECHRSEFRQICAICEDYFDKPTKPSETRFVLTVEDKKEHRMKPGIYQVLKFPYFRSDGFSLTINDYAVKLIRDCDANKEKRQRIGQWAERVSSDAICDECFNKNKKVAA